MNSTDLKLKLESIIKDSDLTQDVIDDFNSNSGKLIKESIEVIFKSDAKDNIITDYNNFVNSNNISDQLLIEAIVHLYARPALLIQNGTYVKPDCKILADRLDKNIGNIEYAIKGVGRIEIKNHENLDWIGTGWLVQDNVIVTNRHVASIFALNYGKDKLIFKTNLSNSEKYDTRVDFKRELASSEKLEFKIMKVLYIAGDNDSDLALLEIRKNNGYNQALPLPLDLELDISDKIDTDVVVIGYPAFDPRNKPIDDMNRIFDNFYDVKRLQPGKITSVENDECFLHDCSTLGGNSGSPVIDVNSGKVLGIHYAGEYLKSNRAIPSQRIYEILQRL
jgi:endonuclease G